MAHPPAGRPHRPIALRTAHLYLLFADARPHRVRPLPALHPGVRLLGGEGSCRRTRPRSPARHPAEHSRAGLHAGRGPGAGVLVPTKQHRPGAGLGAHDLHRPGVEHDLQLLSLAPVHSEGPDRGLDHLSLRSVAAAEVARASLLHDRPRLEQHDEHGRRLVLPHDHRVVPARRQGLPPPGHRLLHERRRGEGRRPGDGLGDRGDGPDDRLPRSIAMAPRGRLGPEVPSRGGRLR